jgi:hypothetical protein
VHDPEIFTSAPSGPPYVPEVQDAIPDGPPSPENDTETGLVYQPSTSGPRANDAVTDGGLESFFTLTLLPMKPPAASVIVHVSVVPAVSSVIVVDPQPVAPETPPASYDQLTVTFDLNQPPQPPPLHEGAGMDAAPAVSGRSAHAPATAIARHSRRARVTPPS